MLRTTIPIMVILVCSLALNAEVNVEKTSYKGWPNCYRVSNGQIELIVTGDVGPRIIRFGFVGGQNLFKEFADQMGKSGEATFQPRGGDRVWKAPEDPVASWSPDNVPVEIIPTATGLIARAPVEPLTSLQKEIEVSMSVSATEVTVTHRITNHSHFPLEFSAWALTMMAQGGLEIVSFPPRGHHPANLEPTNPLTMWAYTNLTDSRWKFTRKYLTLRQDPNNPDPQKLGTFSPNTWAAYLLHGEAFVKRATADPSKAYPDFGCSLETFTNNDFVEIETLSAITKLAPGQTVDNVEHWSLHRNVSLPAITDNDIDAVILPLVQSWSGH
jgi:hypothetical protein